MSDGPSDAVETRTPATRESELLHQQATIDYKHEIVRKSIHLCSLSIPGVYYFISKELALAIIIPITLAFFSVDLARHYHTPTREWFYRWFGWLLRKHESDEVSKRLTGATNILISGIICILIFPKIIIVNAFAILILSDITSALVGRRFGKKRFLHKSREGALGFFLAGLIVVLLAPKVEGLPAEYLIGVLGVAVGAVVESLFIKIDDNISVPLAIGFVMWALYAFFLPGIDLYKII
jgi:dolichol kinase